MPRSQVGQAETAPPAPTPFWKRPAVVIVGTCLAALVFFLGLHYLVQSFTHESTDDAFLSVDVTAIAPRIGGQVARVFVNDNQIVKTGEPLIQIDPRDYEVQVAQKQAAMVASEANVNLLLASIDLLKAQVATADATARQFEAEAAADKATAEKAQTDLQRAEDLRRKNIISPQEYDAAKAAATSTEATLRSGQEKAASNRLKVAEAQAQLEAGRRAWERAQAQSKQSLADVQQAQLNLSYTHIVAPVDGRVTRKAVSDGDYVQVGQRLLALVPNEIWITANFKETQLRNIRPGQPVHVSIDSGGAFPAHVDSIQAGSGAAFSLLPPENAVGNFVKVVQRVPVKIVFDHPPQTSHVLGPGMSVEPSVRTASFEVSGAVLALVALVLALLLGSLWWRAATRAESGKAKPVTRG
ncbi:MAG TPA: HlyD family secretion protein [Verrucomicrobiae bacterium]|nr:HlyD family secretion protein [Verrucomicrobiae bacterium]